MTATMLSGESCMYSRRHERGAFVARLRVPTECIARTSIFIFFLRPDIGKSGLKPPAHASIFHHVSSLLWIFILRADTRTRARVKKGDIGTYASLNASRIKRNIVIFFYTKADNYEFILFGS